jgi:hypothetical protein
MRVTLRDAVRSVKRSRMRAAARVLVAAVFVASATVARSDEPPASEMPAAPWLAQNTPLGRLTYAPGRGLRVGDTGLHLGGYGNLNLVRPEGGPARFGLDDLSLFVTWNPLQRVQLFSELEVEDLVQVDDNGAGGTNDATFTVERLYADVAATDWLNLRVGKFLTPVGRWNLIHAQPLTWTSSRPLATELPFDPHTTGAMLFGALYPSHGTLAWSAYGQATNQFEQVGVPQPQQRAGGARLEYVDRLDWSVGASYLAAQNHDVWRQLGGVDGLWRSGRFELMGEATIEQGDVATLDQWGLYLQGVVETWAQVFVVGRYEHYAWRTGPHDVNLFVAGLAYKPWPWLVLKTEYLAADHPADEEPPGYRASVAVLF